MKGLLVNTNETKKSHTTPATRPRRLIARRGSRSPTLCVTKRAVTDQRSAQVRRYKQLHKAVDQLIWAEWDPIGVNQFEGARDEYLTYIPQIVNLLLTDRTEREIAAHLSRLANDLIGDSEVTDLDKKIAKKLKALK